MVFARPPIAGRVKTRLIPAIGAEAAATLYRRLLEHTLDVIGQLQDVEKELWCDGSDADDCNGYAKRFGMALHLQQGDNLGERMCHAFETALQKFDLAVLIGSDSPEYKCDYLVQAFAALQQYDVVLGPAADGGYLLIGMKRAEERLFDGISWGSDKVLDQTRKRLAGSDLTWLELPTLHDVDEPGDLSHFPELISV